LNDSHSHPVFHHKPHVSIDGGDNFGLDVGGEGHEFKASFTAEKDGEFPISVSVDDIHLAKWTLHVKPAPVDPAHSKVDPQEEHLNRYDHHSFNISLNDSHSHPVFHHKPHVSIEGGDDFGLDVSGEEHEFKASFTAEKHGEYPISVSVGDIHLAKWTLHVKPAPVDAGESKVEPQEENRNRYQETEFTIALKDKKGHGVHGVEPKVHISGGESFDVKVQHKADNYYTATYVPDKDGEFPIEVSASEVHLAKWNVHVHKAPVDPAHSSVDPQETTREIGQETSFSITLKDSHSNPVFDVEPTVSISGASFSATVSGSDDKNVYKATYKPDKDGDYPISVSAGDVSLANWSVHVPAPPPPPEEKKKSKSSSSSSSSSSSD
jgi:hypothetical protein